MGLVPRRQVLALAIVLLAGSTLAQSEVVVRLAAVSPGNGATLGWSPKGQKIPLEASEDAMRGVLHLGPAQAPPIAIVLRRSEGSEHWDQLGIDSDRDGEITASESLTSTPSERRGKIWSSFTASIPVPVTDPWTGEPGSCPYALNFWYVEDPEQPEADPVIRFSRRGWFQGEAQLEVPALVLVTEMQMDGVLDRNDRWALAPASDPEQLLESKNARSVSRHAWLGERPWRIVALDPSGMKVTLAQHDPGLTRAEEARQDDPYADDRDAKRSGGSVAFLHDLEVAEKRSHAEGKPLLVKFETTWCGPCKAMDRYVYNTDRVVAATEAMIAVKVDGDENRAAVARFGVVAYPTMILLDSASNEIRRETGYQGVAAMEKFLQVTPDAR